MVEINSSSKEQSQEEVSKTEVQTEQILPNSSNLFGLEESVVQSAIRKFARVSGPPICHKDYALTANTHCNYPLSNYITYDHLSKKHQCFLSIVSNIKEPGNFEEAQRDEN